MRSDLQDFQDYLDGSADPETAARIEAELQDPDNRFARFLREARESSPPGDPLERIFSSPQILDEDGNIVTPESPASTREPRVFRIPRRRVLTALAWAASILLVFSIDRLVLRPGGEPDLDATGARVTPGGALGGQVWTIEVPSDRRAFVTIAVLGPNNIPEYYPESGKLLDARPGKPLTYAIQGNAGDSLFVILTETPARDLLHDTTDLAVKTRQQTWRDAGSFRAFLEETLRSLGFRRFAVRRIVLIR